MKDVDIIDGVVAMFDDKAWGVECSDGKSTRNGFVELNKAKISDPKFCKKPQDKTYRGSHEELYLARAKLVRVRRTIITEVIEE